jgi:hypothetical protein
MISLSLLFGGPLFYMGVMMAVPPPLNILVLMSLG